MKSLLSRYKLGSLDLANRVVMAPLTRCRADSNHVPTKLMIEYYRQRSSAGLIITESISISPNGDGYTRVPGIYTREQQAAWREITAAVHEKGGKIFAQLMHVGRVAHSYNKAQDAETTAPSAITVQDKIYTDRAGMQDMAIPRALGTEEVKDVIQEYRQATEAAFACGFDGVELHATSGYLPMQFLSSGSNVRTDKYGGNVHNRVRFVLETLEAITSVAGADKIGIRIWPGSTLNGIYDEDPVETYTVLLQGIKEMGLAYVHVIDSTDFGIDSFKLVKEQYTGAIMLNAGFTYRLADQAIKSGQADLISFGIDFIANPDLVERFTIGAELNQADPNTFYTPGAKGYIDYPMMNL
jgi:N-ethylmaleimide reductase